MTRATIVVPSIRPERIGTFLEAWAPHFHDCRVIVVEDYARKTMDLPAGVEHYSWTEIDADLGDDAWIIPRYTDCIRSYGFLKALEEPTGFIWTLDDDCLPEPGHADYVQDMDNALRMRIPIEGWWNTLEREGFFSRGYPYPEARTVLHHGLWSGVPDLDARTQMVFPDVRLAPTRTIDVVPRGKLFPMCGMNLAFLPVAVPALYFLLMGPEWPYDRFGDIWAGIFFKRIADFLKVPVTSGWPSVHHSRASDPETNFRKEQLALLDHNSLWTTLQTVRFSGTTPAECYRDLARQLHIGQDRGTYAASLSRAMLTWCDLAERRLL